MYAEIYHCSDEDALPSYRIRNEQDIRRERDLHNYWQ